jgi:hypothetical protein
MGEVERALADGDCERYQRAAVLLLIENTAVLLPDVERPMLEMLHSIAFGCITASAGMAQSVFLSDVVTAPEGREAYILAHDLDVEEIDQPDTVRAPRNLIASLPEGEEAVVLSWEDAANNEDEHLIQRMEVGIFEDLARIDENATGYEDREISPGASYTYRVKACNQRTCSSSSNHASLVIPGVLDTIPPGAVHDLFASAIDETSIRLYWTSPGDDGYEGRAVRYHVRLSDSPITETNWETCSEIGGVPPPFIAGNIEAFRVRGLLTNTTYYFALKTADERGNLSSISNVAEATTDEQGDNGPDNVGWWIGFAPPPDGQGLNGMVYTMEIYGERLIVGGGFSAAGGFPANHIAAWNGSVWRPLLDGTDGDVRAMTVYDGELIVGGFFDHAGGVEAPSLARWDGSGWKSLGGGTDGAVFALTVYNGDLIVGGSFHRVGDVSVFSIARWDGAAWHPMGSGVNAQVFEFAEYQGDLIVGGDFGVAGGVAGTTEIAGWDGTEWFPLGTGMDRDYVHAIAEYQGDLYAGGQFVHAGGIEASNFARWDGIAWHPIGQGVDYWIHDMVVFEDELFVVGQFSHVNTLSALRIARWNGIGWARLGSGLNGVGRTLAVFHGSLYVGGTFTEAGERPSSKIARWDPRE